MKRVDAASKGMVDLFENDLYGMERSVEVVKDILTKQPVETSLVASLPSFQDELLPALWEVHTQDTKLPNRDTLEAEMPTKRCSNHPGILSASSHNAG